jgi:hypothetical protein
MKTLNAVIPGVVRVIVPPPRTAAYKPLAPGGGAALEVTPAATLRTPEPGENKTP